MFKQRKINTAASVQSVRRDLANNGSDVQDRSGLGKRSTGAPGEIDEAIGLIVSAGIVYSRSEDRDDLTTLIHALTDCQSAAIALLLRHDEQYSVPEPIVTARGSAWSASRSGTGSASRDGTGSDFGSGSGSGSGSTSLSALAEVASESSDIDEDSAYYSDVESNKDEQDEEQDEEQEEPVTKKRSMTCGKCGKMGHNSRTCGKEEQEEEQEDEDDEPAAKKRSMTCGKCGKKGHNSRTCGKEEDPEQQVEKKQKICGKCGKPGHNARTCSKTKVKAKAKGGVAV